MFALIRKFATARAAVVTAGVAFCETCAEGVSTAAQRAEARLAHAHEHALTAGYRF